MRIVHNVIAFANIGDTLLPFPLCRSADGSHGFDESLIEDLTKMIDEWNAYAKSYRLARDYIDRGASTNCYLRLIRHRGKDARMHNIPTCDEVAALIIGDDNTVEKGRDIICKKKCGQLERLPETHTSFIPLQYPMLFPFGEDGYQEHI